MISCAAATALAFGVGACSTTGAGVGAGPPAGDTTTSTTPTTSTSRTPTTSTPSSTTTAKQAAETGPEPGFDQLHFSNPTSVTNTWLPLKPGTQLVYEGKTIEDGETSRHRTVFTVTDLTKLVAGVRTVVVWDRDFADDQLQESELAFFAQADDGNVWHFGQYPEGYEDGKLVETPAWIHGVKGAQAGLTMKAHPQLGARSYSQGWGPEVGWSDRATAVKTGQRTCVRAGCYTNVLVIDEFSLDEPGAHQLKYYAPGVGNVRVGWAGNDRTKETLQLVSVVHLSAAARSKVRQEALRLERNAYQRSKDVYGTTEPMGR
ncbi:MAG TPA: hypothetical protein VFJ97_09525 [Dermatophilaceae bacterium]|nr:hypothetical protein [Dermatophilaceae bacterium]